MNESDKLFRALRNLLNLNAIILVLGLFLFVFFLFYELL